MPVPNHRRRRLVQGAAYASGSATPGAQEGTTSTPLTRRLAHLTASPEELGLIGAELAKRLTMAAEDFLSELAADQVRGSFRGELVGFPGEDPEVES
jgi:hypothetical protein